MNPSISVVAICFNEERDLPGFLNNVLPWANEVILVDDGSTDRTREIALQAGDKVKFIEHKRTVAEGFGGQRNVGISHASSDWVLNMDIDERLSFELYLEIQSVIKNSEKNAYRYRRTNYFLHRPMKKGGWDSWNQPQLARRNKHHYINAVHEQCIVEGEIGQLEHKMLHLNDDSYAERMRKSMQYCRIDAEKMFQEGKHVKAWHIAVKPVATFIKNYFLKAGCVDGVPGLISAMHSAGASFRTLALVWDMQNEIKRSELEERIKKSWKL